MMRAQSLIPLSLSIVLVLALSGSIEAAQVMYTVESDAPGASLVSDDLAGDGQQNGTFTNDVFIDDAPSDALFGSQSLGFPSYASKLNTVEIAGLTSLGTSFTLATFARLDKSPDSRTRLFSSYLGSGGVASNDLIYSYYDNGTNFRIGNDLITPPQDILWKTQDGDYHHMAATYDDGGVRVYVDGIVVAAGSVSHTGPLTTARNLRLGDDEAGLPKPHEQFVGQIDDVVVLSDTALSDRQVRQMALLGGDAFFSAPRPVHSGILYTGEADTPSPLAPVDAMPDDGRQNGTIRGSVGLNTDPAHAAFGGASYSFPGSYSLPNTITFDDSRILGDKFTLSAFVKTDQVDDARLFTSYLGENSVLANDLVFQFDTRSNSPWNNLLARIGNDILTPAEPVAITTGEYHHLAMTYDDGLVRIYLDGEERLSGSAGGGPLILPRDLNFGEDHNDRINEQFAGFADDLMILRRVLSGEEMRLLAASGAVAFIPEPSAFLLGILALGGLAAFRGRRTTTRSSP